MTDNEATRTVTVINREGFHLRAASLLVNSARQFDSAISIVKGNQTVDGKSTPLQLLGLGAEQGEMLVLRATGHDAHDALDVLANLFASRFEEPPSNEHQEVNQG
ncbi:MAG: HPr family phosphocarrier protein [Pirellulales bacterium]|nr:HPr family phosphocarrier protein [Pirellulales bacterium]